MDHKICNCLVTLESEANYHENQSRRKNLIFYGMKEFAHEKWEDTEKHVRKLIFEKLNLLQMPVSWPLRGPIVWGGGGKEAAQTNYQIFKL